MTVDQLEVDTEEYCGIFGYNFIDNCWHIIDKNNNVNRNSVYIAINNKYEQNYIRCFNRFMAPEKFNESKWELDTILYRLSEISVYYFVRK